MICDVCGRDNAANLTFCQDCGRRLRQKRGVAPTPPNGIPMAAAPPAARETPEPEAATPASTRKPRPAAPVFSFGAAAAAEGQPRVTPAPVAPASPVDAPSQAPAPIACGECASPNPPEFRFCVTCGAALARSAAKAAPAAPHLEGAANGTKAPAPPARAVPPPFPASPRAAVDAADGEKIVGAPVVDIAASGSVPARIVTCARCHGHCLAGTRFCKFCGAPLEEAAFAPTPPRGRAALDGAAPERTPPRDPLEVGKVPLAPVDKAPEQGPRPAPRPVADAPIPVPAAVEPRPLAPPPKRVEEGAGAPDFAARHVPDVQPIRSPAAPPAEEPGTRTEISEMAGSPVPAEPIPLPRRTEEGAARPGQPHAGSARWKGGRLVVIVEDGSEGKSFSLAEGQLDIGRTEGDIILEDDPYVSPRHARLRRGETSWIVRDLDSTNRVYVRLRKPHPLRDGDLLLLGLEVLQFQTVTDGERGHGHAIQHGTFVFGSPATRGSLARARLCQRTVEGVIRDVYHLFRDETIIGREVGDIVFTADPFLSRRHAAVRRNPVSSEFSLVDLESSNGTYVAIRGEVAIGDGDYLRIGQHLFRVDLG